MNRRDFMRVTGVGVSAALLARAHGASRAHAEGPGATAPPPSNGIHVICRNFTEPEREQAYEGILRRDYVSGLLVYLDWQHLEPEEGVFRWELLERPVRLAYERGKTVAIGIMVQVYSPSWVLDRSATYSYRHIHPSVGVVRSPIPWDPIYVDAVKRMVSAVAERCDGRPGIHYIAMTGPSSLFGVETNFPMADLTPDMASRLAYTNERFQVGWKEMVDHFMRVFQRSDVSLGLHHDIPEYLGGDRMAVMKTVRGIRDHAITRQAERGGGRLVMRLLGLGLDNPRYFPGPYPGDDRALNDYLTLVWEVRDRVDIGFEVTRVFSRANAGRPPLSPEEFRRVLHNGLSYGPRWIEVKEWDVWDAERNEPYAPYVPVLAQINAELRSAQPV